MIPLKDDIPTRRTPVITIALIVINVLVYFAFEQGGLSLGDVGNQRVVEYGAIPVEITHPGTECVADQDVARDPLRRAATPARLRACWLTLFTSMFLHGSLLHLAGNMLFLWIFGNNIEDSMARPDVRRLLLTRRAWPRSALQVVDGPELGGADRRRERGDSRRCSAPTRGCIRARGWSRWSSS